MSSIWFIIAGLAIRSWSNCYAIKSSRLTTSGPYAFVRNPLYLGSFLIMAGFLVMLQVPWYISLVFIALIIGVVYMLKVRSEQKSLLDKFGAEYESYFKSVPAFFPTFKPYKGGEKWGANFGRYFRSQEYKLVIWVIIAVIAFHLKEEFMIEHESIDAKIVILIVVSVLLGLLDVVGEFFRKTNKITADMK
jgi:isoprenylcysteine carboxyl methyltransferase (ICMT) family protein YpbQ